MYGSFLESYSFEVAKNPVKGQLRTKFYNFFTCLLCTKSLYPGVWISFTIGSYHVLANLQKYFLIIYFKMEKVVDATSMM